MTIDFTHRLTDSCRRDPYSLTVKLQATQNNLDVNVYGPRTPAQRLVARHLA